ncbi:MAG: HYR domain-containing protein [Saprospiraceae bacterium]|nr:HYR domain-containing protein [Saprospiraceae bacterium]
MKKQFLKAGWPVCSLLVVGWLGIFSVQSHAQCVPPPPCIALSTIVDNPVPPGCKGPGDGPFKILVILDESSSVGTSAPQVRLAVSNFADKLEELTDAPGKLEMGLIEFNNDAFNALPPNFLYDVESPGFVENVTNHMNSGYNPSSCTNYEAALNKAMEFPRVDLIFFITDGQPQTGNIDPSAWSAIANSLKSAPRKTYIFAIGIGADICNNHLKNLSGPHQLNVDASFAEGADWTLEDFSSLSDGLVDLANSLFDTKAPVITCPLPIKQGNDPGKCGKIVSYVTTATDECENMSLVCTPPPGSFFNVGPTIVTCTATDKAGNTASCTFKITILDLEAPKITCPAGKLISCEESSLPANTGTATATDNCGVGGISHKDVRIDGSCENEFTLQRSWTAADVHGNITTCMQIISVEDKKPPVISCPANATVTCDISVGKTGSATATDNCDTDLSITHRDIPISGDCDWFCITERHWTATDNCGNTSKCVQVITKDVTPLIEEALASGPLVWGQTAATVTLPAGKGNCVVKWLPYAGVTPTALKFDDAVAGADCRLMSNPLDPVTGQIMNPLLGEAMKLKILVRLNPDLGKTKLSAIPCDMHFIVRQALAPNPDVNELLRVTDLTLGNVNVSLLVPEHTKHLLDVLKCVNKGRSVCKP